MRFDLPEHVLAQRELITRIVERTMTAEAVRAQHATGTFANRDLYRALAAEGLVERAIPGRGEGDPIELWSLFNCLEQLGAPYEALAMAVLVAGVVQHVGTDEQRAEVIPAIASGEALVCFGYSEPDFGSDLAGVVTRAVRDGDDWVIDGAKMWTTMAHEARWVLLLTRTDPDRPKHRGLTMFLVPMDTPGITVEPVHTMATERTNATFYDGVRVPDSCRLGEVHGGWDVMAVALSFERGVVGGTSPGVPLLRHAARWCAEVGLLDDPVVRERLARIAIDHEVGKLLTQRAAWLAATGALPGLEGSMAKLFATERYQQATAWCQQLAGPAGLLQLDEPGAAADGWIEYDARHAPVTTIYGGTSEIARNHIAQQHLRLPRPGNRPER